MKGSSRQLWSLWSQYDELELQDLVLYRRWVDEATNSENLQLFIPKHLKSDLLHELHDNCGRDP